MRIDPNTIIQVVLFIGGLGSVYFSTAVRFKVRRIASLFGTTVGPFWLYSSAVQGNWGVFALSVILTIRWIQVFIRDWIRHEENTI